MIVKVYKFAKIEDLYVSMDDYGDASYAIAPNGRILEESDWMDLSEEDTQELELLGYNVVEKLSENRISFLLYQSRLKKK